MSGFYVSGGGSAVLFATLTTPTAEVASGDVLADTQQLSVESHGTDYDCFLQNGGAMLVVGAQVIDKGAQDPAFDIVLLRSNTALGTENSAPSIADSNALEIIKIINVTAADYNDLNNFDIAEIDVTSEVINAALASKSLYVAAIARETYTPSAADNLTVRIGVIRDLN